mmetsp:Transcript_133226/g.244975  ORF Transcript_133226/g.244975 Transcript_133226/m.244975 type:complete len:91 (-) Transcript_133226:36-308(-)
MPPLATAAIEALWADAAAARGQGQQLALPADVLNPWWLQALRAVGSSGQLRQAKAGDCPRNEVTVGVDAEGACVETAHGKAGGQMPHSAE